MDVRITRRGDIPEELEAEARRAAARIDHLAGGRVTRLHVLLAQDGPPTAHPPGVVAVELELDGEVHRVRAADAAIPLALDGVQRRLVAELREAAAARAASRHPPPAPIAR